MVLSAVVVAVDLEISGHLEAVTEVNLGIQRQVWRGGGEGAQEELGSWVRLCRAGSCWAVSVSVMVATGSIDSSGGPGCRSDSGDVSQVRRVTVSLKEGSRPGTSTLRRRQRWRATVLFNPVMSLRF